MCLPGAHREVHCVTDVYVKNQSSTSGRTQCTRWRQCLVKTRVLSNKADWEYSIDTVVLLTWSGFYYKLIIICVLGGWLGETIYKLDNQFYYIDLCLLSTPYIKLYFSAANVNSKQNKKLISTVDTRSFLNI